MTTLPGYYTTKEAAEKLGFKTPNSLADYAAQGKIPGATKVGRSWLIPENWVELMEKTPLHPKGNRGLERKAK